VDTCFELTSTENYKEFFDEFLKTFIGYYREKVGWVRE